MFDLAFDQYIYLKQIQKYAHCIIIYKIGRASVFAKTG